VISACDCRHRSAARDFAPERAKRIGHRIMTMRDWAAAILVAIALTMPAYAQHGAARGGFSGHSGFSGHAGSAGHSGFTGARGISRPAPSSGQARFARPGFGRLSASGLAGTRVPYRGPGYAARRPLYRPAYGNRFSSWNRNRRRGPWTAGSFGYGYPGWARYPYPFVIDPGFYNWGDSGDSGYGSNGAATGYADATPIAGYDSGPEPMQEPSYAQAAPADASMPRPAYAASNAAAAEQPITVIFKNGRTPETMQNYMVNSRALTDLDQQHYEQIPLDQIDVAATEQANRVRGLQFQIPAASRE
jgi:hypothetical protein